MINQAYQDVMAILKELADNEVFDEKEPESAPENDTPEGFEAIWADR